MGADKSWTDSDRIDYLQRTHRSIAIGFDCYQLPISFVVLEQWNGYSRSISEASTLREAVDLAIERKPEWEHKEFPRG